MTTHVFRLDKLALAIAMALVFVLQVLGAGAVPTPGDMDGPGTPLVRDQHGDHEHAHGATDAHAAPVGGLVDHDGPSALIEPPRGPLFMDSWVEPGQDAGDVTITYQWVAVGAAQDPRIEIHLDEAIDTRGTDFQPQAILSPIGEDTLELHVPETGTHTVRILLFATVHGETQTFDRNHYLARNADGVVRAVAADEIEYQGEAAIVLGETPEVLIGDDEPDQGGELDNHCMVDFDARIRTSAWDGLPNNIEDKPAAYIRAQVRDPQGNILATEVAGADGVAHFRNVEQRPCEEDWRLRTQLRWYYGSSERIRMSPAANNNYWQADWSAADIDDGETWTFRHSASLSPQVYMLPQAREAYLEVRDTGRDHWLVYIHRTEGEDNPHDCHACALDDDIWFDGDTRSAESNDRTIYHEYGHTVHHKLAPNGRPGGSYGDHSGCSNCHYYDSAHDTTGSALVEGWADVFVGMVTGKDVNGGLDLETPDNSRSDHPSLECRGAYRECAFAAAIWDTYENANRNLDHFLDVLEENPQDIHDFEQIWDNLGKPSGGLDGNMRRVHITPNGDSTSQGDAGNSFTGAIDGDTYWKEGVVTYEPHQSSVDRNDYYTVQVDSGERVRITLYPPSNEDLDLYLYDPTNQLVDSSTLNGDTTEDVSGEANSLTQGQWRFRVRQDGSSQGMYEWDIEYGDFDDLDPPSWTSHPNSIGGGASYDVCWNVPGYGDITHTEVHWGTSSGNLNRRSDTYSGEAPESFCATLTAPASGRVYLKAHAMGVADNLYGDLLSINVVENRVDRVAITQAPASVLPNANFMVCWETFGKGPVQHTHLHVVQDLVALSLSRSTAEQSSSGPDRFCQSLQAPPAGTVEVTAHAEASGTEAFDTRTVRVFPYPDI